MAGGNKGDGMQVKLRGNILSHPVASGALILRGCMVNAKATGFAALASDTSSEIFAGISEEGNTAAEASSDGAKDVRVRRKGIFKMTLDNTSKAAAPTLVGQLVYVHTTQTASVDELVGLAANVSNNVLVGKIVKHGTDAQAIAGTSTADVWVDILGTAMTVFNATYTTIASLISNANAAGAALVGIEDSGSIWTATDLEALLDEIGAKFAEQGMLPIPMGAWTEQDGTVLAVHSAAPTPGIFATAEGHGIQWAAHANPDPIAASIPIPLDLNASADVIVHVLAAKTGATAGDAVTWLIEAFNNADGAAYDADANFGGTSSAMTGDATAKDCQEETLTLANANVAGAPCVLQLTLQPTDGTLGTDDVIVFGVWLEYTKLIAASA